MTALVSFSLNASGPIYVSVQAIRDDPPTKNERFMRCYRIEAKFFNIQTSEIVSKVPVGVDTSAKNVVDRSRLSPQTIFVVRVLIAIGVGYGKDVPSHAVGDGFDAYVGCCQKFVDSPQCGSRRDPLAGMDICFDENHRIVLVGGNLDHFQRTSLV